MRGGRWRDEGGGVLLFSLRAPCKPQTHGREFLLAVGEAEVVVGALGTEKNSVCDQAACRRPGRGLCESGNFDGAGSASTCPHTGVTSTPRSSVGKWKALLSTGGWGGGS